jgi:recombination protein RecT
MNEKKEISKMDGIKEQLFSPGTTKFLLESLPAGAKEVTEKVVQRFVKMVYTTISNSPELQNCSVPSIIKAAGIAASLGLDVDPVRGLAWLVPYKNKDKGIIEASFQIGYLGLIELAYRSGKVKAISAHCIYESEIEDIKITRENGRYTVQHPFSFIAPTGKMIAVYATAEVDGFGAFTEVLRVDEVEKVRKCGKAPNSPAWLNHYEAMAKKTAIRRLAKFLPKSIAEDFTRGAAVDEKQDAIEVPTTVSSRFERAPDPQPPDEIEDEIPMDFPAPPDAEVDMPEPQPAKRQLLTRRPPILGTTGFELNLHTWLIDQNAGVSGEQIKAICNRDNVPFDDNLFENDAQTLKTLIKAIKGQ